VFDFFPTAQLVKEGNVRLMSKQYWAQMQVDIKPMQGTGSETRLLLEAKKIQTHNSMKLAKMGSSKQMLPTTNQPTWQTIPKSFFVKEGTVRLLSPQNI
jgi:hypothetical protein